MNDRVYCSAPWHGLTVREDGKVKTCCVGRTTIGDLTKTAIQDIVQSDLLREIQQSMLAGQAHANCETCRASEDRANYSSLRRHYQTYYPLVETERQIKFLDIRWNNKCNLACQYCSPNFSSVWQERLAIPLSPANRSYQDDLLSWILERSQHIREIMLVGGEPMLMKQNYRLLESLPEDCQISIITNLSYDFRSIPCLQNLLDRPRDRIIWNVSAENTHGQFEYVRNGSRWDEFLYNLQFLVANWPNTVSMNMVYSMFNALHLDEIVSFYRQHKVNKFTFMELNNNTAMDVFRMPQEIRNLAQAAAERTQQQHRLAFGIDADLYPLAGLSELTQGLASANNSVIITHEQFNQQIAGYDRWAGDRKFADLWPDVVNLVDQYLN